MADKNNFSENVVSIENYCAFRRLDRSSSSSSSKDTTDSLLVFLLGESCWFGFSFDLLYAEKKNRFYHRNFFSFTLLQRKHTLHRVCSWIEQQKPLERACVVVIISWCCCNSSTIFFPSIFVALFFNRVHVFFVSFILFLEILIALHRPKPYLLLHSFYMYVFSTYIIKFLFLYLFFYHFSVNGATKTANVLNWHLFIRLFCTFSVKFSIATVSRINTNYIFISQIKKGHVPFRFIWWYTYVYATQKQRKKKQTTHKAFWIEVVLCCCCFFLIF